MAHQAQVHYMVCQKYELPYPLEFHSHSQQVSANFQDGKLSLYMVALEKSLTINPNLNVQELNLHLLVLVHRNPSFFGDHALTVCTFPIIPD